MLKNDFPDLEIVINGGIKSVSESLEHLERVDGVMLGRAAYDNPMITSGVDEKVFNEAPQSHNRKEILSNYLRYCMDQYELGISYNRTLKHVFGINKGMPHARQYRKLILESMQKENLSSNINNLVSMV